jgi:hypothetical protein
MRIRACTRFALRLQRWAGALRDVTRVVLVHHAAPFGRRARRSFSFAPTLRAFAPASVSVSAKRALRAVCSLACLHIAAQGPHGNTLRSKTKVLPNAVAVGGVFPDWTFDGSSTGQSDTRDSDCILRPVFSCPDPIRGGNNLLVLCEVMNPDGTPHATNTRAQLRAVIDNKVSSEAPLFGWEQEYTMIGKNGCVSLKAQCLGACR